MYDFLENIDVCLKDAGCDELLIQTVTDDLQAGNQAKAVQLLQKYRQSLLNNLHKDQKRIDCLDYLSFMLNRKKEG